MLADYKRMLYGGRYTGVCYKGQRLLCQTGNHYQLTSKSQQHSCFAACLLATPGSTFARGIAPVGKHRSRIQMYPNHRDGFGQVSAKSSPEGPAGHSRGPEQILRAQGPAPTIELCRKPTGVAPVPSGD
jgi:hypothetical protein